MGSLPRSFKIALVLSLVLHFGFLLGPSWHLPLEEAPLPVLQGRFRLPPRPAGATEQAPPLKPPARPIKPHRQAPVDDAPVAQLPSLPEPVARPTSSTPPPPEPEAPATPSSSDNATDSTVGEVPTVQPISPDALPIRGLMRFDVTRGQQKLQLGRATHSWVREGNAYILSSVTETTGLAAVFKKFKLTQISTGNIGAQGLVPGRFMSRRDDDPTPVTQVDFDYPQGKVIQVLEGRQAEYPLVPGSQDLLSLIYQWVLLAPQDQTTIRVATGKSYNDYKLRLYGDEEVETKVGTLHTRHYGTLAPPGERSTEVWLALDYDLLPVRIRFNEKDGEIWEMTVTEAAFGGVYLKPQSNFKLPGE